jgi:hypothetical protein
VSAKAANPFKTAVTATDTSRAEYDTKNVNLVAEIFDGNGLDPLLDQTITEPPDFQILQNGKAKFFIRITNKGSVALNTVSITDTTATTCGRTS